eukprot:IDg2198t1
MNRTLKDLVRAMLHHKRISLDFWAEAICTAAYTRNRVTNRGIPASTTPYEIWNGRKPHLAHLRVFGSKCWYRIPKEKMTGLDKRASEAIMIGYPEGQKAYKLWDTLQLKIVVSRDVKFQEIATESSLTDKYEREEDETEPDENESESLQDDSNGKILNQGECFDEKVPFT